MSVKALKNNQTAKTNNPSKKFNTPNLLTKAMAKISTNNQTIIFRASGAIFTYMFKNTVNNAVVIASNIPNPKNFEKVILSL